jgi:hypothetical protein
LQTKNAKSLCDGHRFSGVVILRCAAANSGFEEQGGLLGDQEAETRGSTILSLNPRVILSDDGCAATTCGLGMFE